MCINYMREVLSAIPMCIYERCPNQMMHGDKRTVPLCLAASKTTETTEDYNEKIENVKKLKELLDAGILTQEEFDSKKKEILGL